MVFGQPELLIWLYKYILPCHELLGPLDPALERFPSGLWVRFDGRQSRLRRLVMVCKGRAGVEYTPPLCAALIIPVGHDTQFASLIDE